MKSAKEMADNFVEQTWHHLGNIPKINEMLTAQLIIAQRDALLHAARAFEVVERTMNNYHKSLIKIITDWIESIAMHRTAFSYEGKTKEILDILRENGYLKGSEPPKTIWWCPRCRMSYIAHEVVEGGPLTHKISPELLSCPEKMIKMVEATNE